MYYQYHSTGQDSNAEWGGIAAVGGGGNYTHGGKGICIIQYYPV